ncbi:N-acetyltransferase DgcN [Pacificimonas flava]|uniref:EBNA-1 nuclear protein n=1 Tax=Pacificimonas flava TaxID=1234595 RepID=M2U4A3_9SPHN|nr:N-acetyltransferase DgcN [Pacificimonas flava]EMD82813.1 EBNA-1 nuclear protein [Pacificimonas flava]MBB5279429.1 putative NAD-dependent epimerase/dehydratase family protein [Pacificimonas flava]
MIKTPYLLYLGSATDELSIKTSRGLAMFRPDGCVGEFRHDDCPLTLGLPRLGFSDAAKAGAKTLVLGVANAGGRMGAELIADAAAAMEAGLDLASGLHSRLKAEPMLVETAQRTGRTLHDIRDPRPDLPIGTGLRRAGKRLLTVGTDCSVGKMVTTLCLEQEMRRRGVRADFRATGQTGILIAGSGVPLDAVIADFISGAIEQLSPDRHDGGWDLIEGQGSLFHPSFAGVSTGLLHGSQPDALVLCHEPNRPHMRGLPHYSLPSIADTLAENLRVARLTNADVQAVGVALNTSKMEERAARQACDAASDETNLPCTDPFRFGAGPIADRLQAVFTEAAHASIA